MEFNCNGFSIKLVKIVKDTWSRELARDSTPAKGHVRSTCGSWRVSVFRNSSCGLANSRDDLQNALTVGILSVTIILFTHTIYSLITHKKCKEDNHIENPREVFTTPTLLERTIHPQERNSCSLFSSPFPLLYFERWFVPKHNSHLFRA